MGWGRFGYAYKQNPQVTHTPGGGGIAVRPTDMARFGYLLLHEGRWKEQQLVPAEYVHACSRKSVYNPHFPFSLLFEVNTDGQIPDLPRDTFFKPGAGGHVFWIIPSLDLVVWRLAGRDDQYDEANTGLPLPPKSLKAATLRKDWKPTINGEVGSRQVIRKVIESIINPGPVAGAREKQAPK
jgi:CubicO group peptidase (beta-lactamase class C family)